MNSEGPLRNHVPVTVDKLKTLYDFQQNNILCDGIIQLDDNSTVPIHKVVLSLKSSYFRISFTTGIHSKEKTKIYLPEISHSLMLDIILYCYTETIEITDQNVYNLMKIADYLNISGLENLCANYLIGKLNAKNCIEVLSFAENVFNNRLCDQARRFLYKNFERVMSENSDLLKLDIDSLNQILKSDYLNVKSEEIVWQFILQWIEVNPDERKQSISDLITAPRLGLLNTEFFMEKVKQHPYVKNVPEIRTIVIKTLQFLYDLDSLNKNVDEILPVELTAPRFPYEILIVLGGWSGGAPTNYIEAYDTRADRWTVISDVDPLGARAYHGQVAIENNIYIIGGFDGVEYFNTCRKFDAVQRVWTAISPMHLKRCYVSVAVLNGKIYAMGGYDGNTRQNTAERYDPLTNQWSLIAPMNIQRSDADACVLNGKVYITGGFNGQECLNSAEFYDEKTNRWTLIEPMHCRRSGVSCIGLDSKVYVLGGFNGITRINSCEVYDPATKSWSAVRDMYNTRSNFAVEVVDDLIFAIGGFNGVTTIFQVECYDKRSGEWYEATDMCLYRSALAACVLKNLPDSAIEYYMYQNRKTIAKERKTKLLAINNNAASATSSNDVSVQHNQDEDFESDLDLSTVVDVDNATRNDFDSDSDTIIFDVENMNFHDSFDDGFDADADINDNDDD